MRDIAAGAYVSVHDDRGTTVLRRWRRNSSSRCAICVGSYRPTERCCAASTLGPGQLDRVARHHVDRTDVLHGANSHVSSLSIFSYMSVMTSGGTARSPSPSRSCCRSMARGRPQSTETTWTVYP